MEWSKDCSRQSFQQGFWSTQFTVLLTWQISWFISQSADASTGGRMQDCGIPKGPIAYTIGNSAGGGNSCKAKSQVVGFLGSFKSLPKGTIGMGYINPLLENAAMRRRFKANSQNSRMGNARYREPMFNDYSQSNAKDYIRFQAEHWLRAAESRGQSCVAVDIDNCDVIKSRNYEQVLNVINQLNKSGRFKSKIKVLVKNPQNGCGNFMKNPDVIGAFIEELSASDLSRLLKLRANPDQVLLFAQGDSRGRSHISLDAISKRKIPNSAVSFDGNGAYKSVKRCTYSDGGSRPMSTRSPASQRPLMTSAQ